MNMKQTPKPLRIQAIANSAIDSPLRRRSGIHVVTASPVELSNTINDDNEERRLSRRIEEESFTDSSSNLIQETEALNMCLQLHSDNKISKDNAWSVSIIDTWSKLIKKHHKTLQNFQIAGSTLEASTRVYSLRVDSVYNDVIRMSSELSRQSAKALNKKITNNQDDDDRDQDDADKENNTTVINTQNPATKSKKRKNISTVTKNKDTLNCIMDTNPFIDPFFAKLNSIVGDINSSNRLMQNIIPTHNSLLKLRQNLHFWDDTPAPEFDLDMEPEYDNIPKDIKITSNPMPSLVANVGLHPGLKGYLFSNDQFEEGEDEQRTEQDILNHTTAINSSHMELQFDINAEVEPIAMEKSFVMDFGDMVDDDFDDLNGEDMIAINRCKGLQRQQIVIEDMQPECVSTLEYSYRPLDIIDQFWAGPSHWKFRHSRKTHSVGARTSNGADHDAVVTHQQKQKVVRKRKIVKNTSVLLEDVFNIDNINTFVSKTQKLRCTTITLQTLTKKWDSKKLKLPMDYKSPSDFFDRFQHAPNFHPKNNPNITLTPADDADAIEYNYDNENDRNYCSRVVDASDTETETTDVCGQDHFEPIDNDLMVNQTLDVIPDYFAGAPDKIEKINIAFSKRAKTVDMKQLKTCCWKLINDKKPNDECPDNQIQFTVLLNELPKVLSKTMAENTSMSLAFYSVLHLCNEKSLMLSRESENLNDFDIDFKI
ncbi:unnamed protein product [Diamesa tonsa]